MKNTRMLSMMTCLGVFSSFSLSVLALESVGDWALPGSFVDMAVQDVDGDGHRDLIVLQTSSVLVYAGLGNLTFAQPVSHTGFGWSFAKLAVADMDGDGDNDMVVATSRYTGSGLNQHGAVNFFTNDGTGQFAILQVEEAFSDVSDMIVGDFDGDGDLDVAQTSEYQTRVNIVYNEAIGGAKPQRSFGACDTNGSRLAVADWNGDGDLDLWTVAPDTNGWPCQLTNDGTGTFVTEAQQWASAPWGLRIEIVDVDGDADLDLLYTSGYFWAAHGPADVLIIGRNLGDGTLAPWELHTIAPSDPPNETYFRFDQMALGDWNNDGFVDVAISGVGTAGHLAVAHGNALGHYSHEATEFYHPNFDLSPYPHPEVAAVVASDLDNDGLDDIVVADGWYDIITVYGAAPVCPGDLNDDGDISSVDLIQLLAAWGSTDATPEDLNEDGTVGVADLMLLLGGWGQCS